MVFFGWLNCQELFELNGCALVYCNCCHPPCRLPPGGCQVIPCLTRTMLVCLVFVRYFRRKQLLCHPAQLPHMVAPVCASTTRGQEWGIPKRHLNCALNNEYHQTIG
jgi:hypothetical protein